LRLQM